MPSLWARRQRLCFVDLRPGARCSLPFFLRHADAEDCFLADLDGRPLACCVDCAYEAVDHQLLWLDHQVPEATPAATTGAQAPGHAEAPGCAEVFLYFAQEVSAGAEACRMHFARPEEVLLLAEFFRGGRSALSRWHVSAQTEFAKSLLQVEAFEGPEDGGIGAPACEPPGQSLWLDTSTGHVTLRRSPAVPPCRPWGRLHLRAHFYDDAERRSASAAGSGGSWVGCVSPFGGGAVGLATSGDEFYSLAHGGCPTAEARFCDASRPGGWQPTSVPRSRGWHLLELAWEQGALSVLVDSEPVSTAPAELAGDGTEVRLVSAGGGSAVWAAVELLHTPEARGSWELGVQSVRPGEWAPWRREGLEERGRWQFNGAAVGPVVLADVPALEPGTFVRIVPTRRQLLDAFEAVAAQYSPRAVGRGRYSPGMDAMLGGTYSVLYVLPGLVALASADGSQDGIWCFPPSVLTVAEPPLAPPLMEEGEEAAAAPPPPLEPPPATEEAPVVQPLTEERPDEDEAKPVPQEEAPQEGLAIECWMVPGEADIARMERVMAFFVAKLHAEGVALPDNIRLVGQCRERQHAGCFVYRFGTRRVHVSARADARDSSRLLLVVRCGGGFVDFVDFARRHGNLEQIRLRRPDSQSGGRDVLRLTSVLSKGQVRVRPSIPTI